jgi:hypothetical protein
MALQSHHPEERITKQEFPARVHYYPRPCSLLDTAVSVIGHERVYPEKSAPLTPKGAEFNPRSGVVFP